MRWGIKIWFSKALKLQTSDFSSAFSALALAAFVRSMKVLPYDSCCQLLSTIFWQIFHLSKDIPESLPRFAFSKFVDCQADEGAKGE